NTFFIEPPVARSESDVLAGTYGGIGVNLSRSVTGQFVLTPFEGSPAMEAGIRDGDLLVAIDGIPLDLATQQDVIDQMLRGEVTDGNGVEITFDGRQGERTVFIEFDVINVPSVVWRITTEDQSIGYVQILRFTNRTPAELEIAVAELSEGGAAGYIVDVRNNGGGLLQEAIEVASIFLDGGPVLYQVTANGEQVYNANGGGSLTEAPLVLLVNGGTASAAELVAGALQDRGRAILIGQQTYGKGTIQQIFALTDASSIHITSAEWFTPNREELDGVGLTPDIAMVPDMDGRDVVLGEALRYLQQLLREVDSQS
ncbi:carboxyl-terminal protease, partial [bacterium]|nr:carboxyl-terminal protease [bacterium]